MATRRFHLIDVFGTRALAGNPLAVIADADGLDTEEMERITRWMNLSETTFLLPPTTDEADYRVRIFTLDGELPFAGHPTLGSCHAWLEAGGRPRGAETVVQECGAGLVRIRRFGDDLGFAAPPLIREGPVDEAVAAVVARVLNVDLARIVEMRWADNGPGWIGVLLESADAVLALKPDPVEFGRHGKLRIGVVGPYPPGSEYAYEVRALFTDDQGGVREDPVTGSLNASVAQWLIGSKRVAPPYTASQGVGLKRQGRIRIEAGPGDTIWVVGSTRTVASGTWLAG